MNRDKKTKLLGFIVERTVPFLLGVAVMDLVHRKTDFGGAILMGIIFIGWIVACWADKGEA